jgi:hypothetical protein
MGRVPGIEIVRRACKIWEVSGNLRAKIRNSTIGPSVSSKKNWPSGKANHSDSA